MVNPTLKGEENEKALVMWALLMGMDHQYKGALKMLKYSVKKFIGFSPLS